MIPRWIRAALGALIFLMFFTACLRVIDPDLGWHLRVGDDILQSRNVPRTDHFSWTMPGHEWVDHEWLTEAVLAFFYNYNWWPAVVFLFALLAFLPFAVWLRQLSGALELALVFCFAILLAGYTAVRPQLVSFVLLFLVWTILWQRYGQNQRNVLTRSAPVLLPAIFFLWANLHGEFAVGLAVLAIFIFFAGRDYLVFAACAAITFINPYGWKVYLEILRVSLSGDTARYITEWQPPAGLLGTLPIATAAMFFVSILAVSGLLIFFAYTYRKQLQPALLASVVLLFAGYVKALKTGPLFFIAAVPFFAEALAHLRAQLAAVNIRHPFSPRQIRLGRHLAVSVWVFLAAFLAVSYVEASANSQARAYPSVRALNFLREQAGGRGLRLFNDYSWGGYLEWQLPEVKVFIDGRMPHWKDPGGISAMQDYVKVMYPKTKDDQAWQEVFARRGVDTVLIRACGSADKCRLQSELVKNSWRVVYSDQTAVVLAPSNPHGNIAP